MADALVFSSLTEASGALEAGRTTSVALTQACLERIEAHNGTVNAFIRIDRDEALKAAGDSDKRRSAGRSLGRLDGIPLAHKDMFDRAGKVSTGGSKILKERTATTTSTLMERIDATGAVDLGTLNMSEFAAGPTGHNVHFGHCRNAWDQSRISAGSSSGSGVAVASRLVFGALGSDTGGSVRLPAAVNGVVGLKATYGRITRHGAMPRSWSLDHVGPLARTVEDVALIYQAVAGPDPRDPSTALQPAVEMPVLGRDLSGVRVGVLRDDALSSVDPVVVQALDASIRQLEKLGATIVEVAYPDMGQVYFTAEAIIKSEAAAIHRKWLKERPQDYSVNARVRTEAGLAVPAVTYIDAMRLRTELTADFMAGTMAGIDVLHLPVVSFPVPTIEETDIELLGGEKVLAMVGRITQFTRPINLLGLPSVSLPIGFDGNGLPIAMQLVGAPFQEARILSAAHAYEQATDFHRQAPKIAQPN